jgi:hypothetical protein
MAIMNRLERDLPKRFACHNCFLLHKYDSSNYLGPCELVSRHCDSDLPCVVASRYPVSLGMEIGSRTLYSYLFEFIHIQHAMRRFHYGPSAGISTDSLIYTQVLPTYGISCPPEQITLISIEAEICSDPATFCLRTQEIEIRDDH